MKILLLNWIDPANPLAGGAEVHLRNIFGRMVQNGHSVTLVSSGWQGCQTRDNIDGIEIHRLGTRYTLSLLLPRYYNEVLRNQGFDIVVEDLNKVPFFSPLWSKQPVALLVHHLFGLSAYRAANFAVATLSCLLEIPIPMIFRHIPTIAVSHSTSEDLVRRGMSQNQITIIPNGIDCENFTPISFSDKFTEPTMLYLGRLKAYKRIDIVLRSIAKLKEKGVSCQLLVAGNGDYQDQLEKLSISLGIKSRVEFLGFVSESRKLELLRKSWLNIFTSTKEGWGITNMEAAACGTPTIASDSPGLRDSVIHGSTGFLIDHGNADALASRIIELINDVDLRIDMGKKCRAYAEQFSWDRSAIRIENTLHHQVVESKYNS